MKRINLILALLCVGFMASCSSNDDTTGGGTTPTKPAASASIASTYVSLFADENCTQPIVENAPIVGTSSNVTVSLPYGTETIYMSYPTSDGVKTIAKDVTSYMTVSENVQSSKSFLSEDPGTAEYMESNKFVTINIAKPEDAVKNYVTNADGFTNYHSSGVAMFEDTWPSKSNVDKTGSGDLFGDFNDFVVDYDLESTVSDEADTLQAWKEDLKVVMHARAMGGGYGQKFGLLLEGLDKQYVDADHVEISVTLGNYDHVADSLKAEVVWQGSNPIIYIENIQNLINKTFMDANGLALKSGFGSYSLYNISNDATLNVGKKLFTVTVTFRGKERSTITAAEHQAQTDNFKAATINTNTQNFFLVTTQAGKTYEIHMPNYATTDAYTTYTADMNDKAAGKVVAKSSTDTYTAADGQVWAIKTPVLTRHATERVAFSSAYPQYLKWLSTKDTQYAKWYKIENADETRSTVLTTMLNGSKIYPFLYISEQW